MTLVCRALATLGQAVEMTSLFKAFQFIRFWSQITNSLSELIGTNAWIFMKFYVVVNYYLVSLGFKFYEDPCINEHIRVVNAQARL